VPPVGFTRLEFLYKRLWAKKDNLPIEPFVTSSFRCSKPKPKTDTDTDTNAWESRKMGAAETLSLGHIGSGPELPVDCHARRMSYSSVRPIRRCTISLLQIKKTE